MADPADDSIVMIEWAAVPCTNPLAGGWIPMTWINGRQTRSDWAVRAHDRDRARALALELAHEQAARYLGDWTIRTIERPDEHATALYHVVVVRRYPAGHLRAGERCDDRETQMTETPVSYDAALVMCGKHTPYRAKRARFWTNAEPKKV